MPNRFILLSGIVLSLLLSTCLGGVIHGTSRTALHRRSGDSLIHPRANSTHPHATVIDKGKGKAGPPAEAVNLSSGEKPLSADEIKHFQDAFQVCLEGFLPAKESSPVQKRKREQDSQPTRKRARTTNARKPDEDGEGGHTAGISTSAMDASENPPKDGRKKKRVVLDIPIQHPLEENALVKGMSYRTTAKFRVQLTDGSYKQLCGETRLRRFLFCGHVGHHKFFLMQEYKNEVERLHSFNGRDREMGSYFFTSAIIEDSDAQYIRPKYHEFDNEDLDTLIQFANSINQAAPEGEGSGISEDLTGIHEFEVYNLEQGELEQYRQYTTQHIDWALKKDGTHHYMDDEKQNVVFLGGAHFYKFVLVQPVSRLTRQKGREDPLLRIPGGSERKLGRVVFTPVVMKQEPHFRRCPTRELFQITEEAMARINPPSTPSTMDASPKQREFDREGKRVGVDIPTPHPLKEFALVKGRGYGCKARVRLHLTGGGYIDLPKSVMRYFIFLGHDPEYKFLLKQQHGPAEGLSSFNNKAVMGNEILVPAIINRGAQFFDAKDYAFDESELRELIDFANAAVRPASSEGHPRGEKRKAS